MEGLSNHERACVEHAMASQAAMLQRTLDWAAINSGSRNLDGLAKVGAAIGEALGALPGTLDWVDPTPINAVDAAGAPYELPHGRHFKLTVRPQAPIQLLLTGHMDTVFGADHLFQETRWIDEGTINGPGTADMKGGIAVMIAALEAVESVGADALGYQVVINSDEEVGSLASAALLAECAAGKRAALTYDPRPCPTARWRARDRAAAISTSPSGAARPMPGAIPKTGATR